jgi:hypothetical protein
MMRAAILTLLLGGCLVVRTYDERIEDSCPDARPEQLARASGPLAIADAIYFVSENGTLARLPRDGGPVSELTLARTNATLLAADDTHLYWPTPEGTLVRMPRTGGTPSAIASEQFDVTALVVDAERVVWAANGLHAYDKATGDVDLLATGGPIFGLDAHDGSYYFSDAGASAVRRASVPPMTPRLLDLAAATYPGPLAADSRAVYYYQAGDLGDEDGGAILLVPPTGGSPVPTAQDQLRILQLVTDENHVYFATIRYNQYRIKRVSRFGGPVTTLACGDYHQQALHLVHDGTSLLWSDMAAVYRLASPGG